MTLTDEQLARLVGFTEGFRLAPWRDGEWICFTRDSMLVAIRCDNRVDGTPPARLPFLAQYPIVGTVDVQALRSWSGESAKNCKLCKGTRLIACPCCSDGPDDNDCGCGLMPDPGVLGSLVVDRRLLVEGLAAYEFPARMSLGIESEKFPLVLFSNEARLYLMNMVFKERKTSWPVFRFDSEGAGQIFKRYAVTAAGGGRPPAT